jgi:hypothetical protein
MFAFRKEKDAMVQEELSEKYRAILFAGLEGLQKAALQR